MRQEKFKMERQGLIEIGDEVEITEYQSFMNYSASSNEVSAKKVLALYRYSTS